MVASEGFEREPRCGAEEGEAGFVRPVDELVRESLHAPVFPLAGPHEELNLARQYRGYRLPLVQETGRRQRRRSRPRRRAGRGGTAPLPPLDDYPVPTVELMRSVRDQLRALLALVEPYCRGQ